VAYCRKSLRVALKNNRRSPYILQNAEIARKDGATGTIVAPRRVRREVGRAIPSRRSMTRSRHNLREVADAKSFVVLRRSHFSRVGSIVFDAKRASRIGCVAQSAVRVKCRVFASVVAWVPRKSGRRWTRKEGAARGAERVMVG